MTSIDYLKPAVFNNSLILSGVTKVNKDSFHETGLSLAPAEILSIDEWNMHLSYFSDSLGVGISDIRYCHQIHSDLIHQAESIQNLTDGDALITNRKRVLIFVKIADCAGILIHDEQNNAIAAVHSGWRGTKAEILPRTISKMKTEYGTNPGDIRVFLSPMAQQENYEVKEEFLELFPDSVVTNNQGRLFFSNRDELILQLLKIGVKKEQIESSDICTIANPEYHSFRRDGKKSGRMAAFIMMR
jgi:YfiH family protein